MSRMSGEEQRNFQGLLDKVRFATKVEEQNQLNEKFPRDLNILEEEGVINGEEMILFSCNELKEGVCVSKDDIDSGRMSRDRVCEYLAKVILEKEGE